MKLVLDRIDTRGLKLDFAAGDAVAIASTTNLRGTIDTADDAMAIRDAQADQLVLAALRLLLGTLTLAAPQGATLEKVVATVDQRGDSLSLDVVAASLDAPEISVVDGGVAVHGRAHLEGVRLIVRGEEGSISATRVELGGFSLRIDEVFVRAELARGSSITIGWGGVTGFGMEAVGLKVPSLEVEVPHTKLAAKGFALSGFVLRGDDIAVGRADIESARVGLDLGSSEAAPARKAGAPAETEPQAAASSTPFFDWRVLDGLSGQLDVDVAVDLTVPIIGRRNATHELRVAIENGAIDFRALEKNLSALEDAILDFSVRDNALVLERVNPLLPLRGHGKPVVAWALQGSDLALADQDRVRLAVLPEASVVGSDDDAPPEDPPAKSPITLRLLRLLNLHARLALAPVEGPITGTLRPVRLGALTVDGTVQYDPGAATPPGRLMGELQDFAASIHGLAVGDASKLDVDALAVGGLSPIEITFADVSPTKIDVDATNLVIEGARVTAR